MSHVTRKTYSYGRKKRPNDNNTWDKALENSPKKKKLPPKKSIWSLASVSPFKNNDSLEKVKERKSGGKNDIFSFNDDDPDNSNEGKNKNKSNKTNRASMKTPEKVLLKLSPQSPSVKSRVFGKAMPQKSVTLSLDDLKNFGSSEKLRKVIHSTLKKPTVNIFRQGNKASGKLNKKTQMSNRVEIDVEFQDENRVNQIATNMGKNNKNVVISNKEVPSPPNQKKDYTKINENKPKSIKQVPKSSIKPIARNKKLKSTNLFTYYDKPKVKDGESTSQICNDSKTLSIEQDDSNSYCGKQTTLNTDAKKHFFEKKDSITKEEMKDEEIFSNSLGMDTLQESQSKLKSPFKSLNARSNCRLKERRFSALPTSILSLEHSGDEEMLKEQNEHKEEVLADNTDIGNTPPESPPPLYTSALFGFSRRDTARRVKKTEKELFTVVRDTKHAHQCLEHGESQQFRDDLEYLLDGLKPTHSTFTRALSTLELAAKCTSPTFRMHMKAHDVIMNVFNSIQDALSDEKLALAASTILFILAKDKLMINFNKKIIEFMLGLLQKKKKSFSSRDKEYDRLIKKVKVILDKQQVAYIDLDEIDSVLLARETLLSFTSQRIGEWFKEEIRTLGGLDHLVDTVYSCGKSIRENQQTNKNAHTMERCLLLLCDMAFRNLKNQQYLDSYANSLLIDSCVRTLVCITTEMNLKDDLALEIRDCLLSMLQLLTNLSHENASGSTKICEQNGALPSILRCALYVPQFLPADKVFDCIVASIGLLINIVEHSKVNTGFLKTSMAPAFYESQSSSEGSSQRSQTLEALPPVESLMQLFLIRFEACKEGDLMEELDKLENEQDERDARMHFQDNGIALTCGDNFDDTVEEKNNSTTVKTIVQSTNKIDLNQKEKQDIKITLKKAHQHMEDSHVAAYTSLLIGLLIEDDDVNEERVHSLLPSGNFQPMKESLEKIFAFMKMTGATNESGLFVISRILLMYGKLETKYQRKL